MYYNLMTYNRVHWQGNFFLILTVFPLEQVENKRCIPLFWSVGLRDTVFFLRKITIFKILTEKNTYYDAP